MDILDILKNNSNELLAEDLELFRTELAVGEYTESYRKECCELIDRIEKWQAENSEKNDKKTANHTSSMHVARTKLQPDSQKKAFSFEEQFRADLNAMRLSDKYKSSFRTYIGSHDEFDEKFVDSHFSMFEPWETEAIVSEIMLSEQFLEKYFSVLDKDKIARYQLFSESFYQKHFSDFDAETVLKKGKNEWRKKENRSKQFAVFLRLKGVQY